MTKNRDLKGVVVVLSDESLMKDDESLACLSSMCRLVSAGWIGVD